MEPKTDPQNEEIDILELKKRVSEHLKSIGAHQSLADINEDYALLVKELYSMGYHYYDSGKYAEATDFFKILTHIDAQKPMHWVGLAASLQMQKLYNEALLAYSTAAALDPENPEVFFHAANCCYSLNHIPEGIKALEVAENIARKKPEGLAMAKQFAFMRETWLSNCK